uniref:Rab-GAP TBC domain-containing protein n=1 Tax=Grammatophora oceanica TaxID=210454 RepID=A0A7S1YEF9_9STRA|mmetsp:Transcript_42327/g.62821  ORF Transcript_42327/g.62821 Transcript_42327/m.62821 type:complete len:467 (+) Transcript_42327:200-1600(+)|eukprot:CAMPEP_0194058430 /NCGR_PEP_ID=MMETSP0009_2-20130614/66285_1 /TAXON_ID=210454 /ORGANISM="Grammatophora oceanica, Strain CCMP 410" /LENGTH=466 /DNA_ID=CAMNT_0038708569 /DNA_START=114 /DNA_END=1514 /DNA_ORIENTATION=+
MANTDGTPKGLPGFLRRSLRLNYEDDEGSSDDDRREDTNNNSPPPTSPAIIPENGLIPPTPTSTPVIPKAVKSIKLSGIEDQPTVERSSETSTDSINSLVDESANTNGKAPHKSLMAQVAYQPKQAASRTKDRDVTYKERQFEQTIDADVVSMVELRRLSWNGVPPYHRAQAWKVMLGYEPVNKSRRKQTMERKRSEYKDAIAQHYDIDDNTRTQQEQETLRQVLVDVPRTAPEVGLFRQDKVRRALSRLLYIWAMRHPASSYVQGINDLATPLMVVFLSDYFDEHQVLDGSIMDEVSADMMEQVEADCYWCLTNLLAGIQDHYTSDQPGVQRMVMRLEELVNRIDSALCEYLRSVGIEFMQFAFKWMNCLLLREFNLPCIIRLWDTYISEGDGGFEEFHVYVCAAFLCQFSSQLQTMEFDELFGFMQNIPTQEWTDTEVEILLSQAYVLSTLFAGSDAHLTSGKR